MKFPLAALLGALVLTASISATHASNDIAFAVPEDGLVTLGVFDPTGRLVRTLHALEPEANFRKGLNGLITAWDGSDDTGKRLPAGHYHIRGYLVPELPVEGVAYHFNDWLAEANAPQINWIDDIAALPGEGLLLTGRTAQGTLVCARHDAEDGFVWSIAFEGQPPARIAPFDRSVILKTASTWKSLSLADGSASSQALPATNPASVAAFTTFGDSVLLATGDRLELFPAATTSPPKPPAVFSSLATFGSTLVGATEEGCFISTEANPFQKVPLPVRLTSLSPGGESTFWFTGTAMDPDETPLVAQADTSGDILRLLSNEAGSPPPVLVRALPDGTGFVVLAQSTTTQTIRLIRKAEESGWTTEWERVIQKTPAFGFFNGTIVPDASAAPESKSFRIRLTENPLTGEHGEINVCASRGTAGTFLSSLDGLPLARISERADITRIAIDRGSKSDSVRVLQGTNSGAEEFLVQDLGKIIPLNVGGIDLP